MAAVIALQKGKGWTHVQLDVAKKLEKSWKEQREDYVAEMKVEAYFGTLRDGSFTPVLIMNVEEQGAGAKQVVDDNCDVWTNVFTTVSKEFGNEWYKYLRKHGFQVVREVLG